MKVSPKVIKKLAGPLTVPLSYFFQRPITVQYPDERLVVPKGYRGHPLFTLENCIACRACERACPVNTIQIDMEIKPDGRRIMYGYYLDLGRCLFCGFCADACPTGAIVMGPKLELMEWKREELVYDIKKFQKLKKELRWKPEKPLKRSACAHPENCIGCLFCVETCPVNAITFTTVGDERILRIDPNVCSGCGMCVKNCPTFALTMVEYESKEYEEEYW